MSYGEDADVGINLQNSGGTPLQNSIYWTPFISEDLGVEKPPLISQSMRGIREEGDHYEGANANTGGIQTEANPVSIGAYLQAMMGVASVVNSGSMYTHTFKPRTTDWDEKYAAQPVTITKNLADAGSSTLFYDMCVTTLELSVANGEFLMANFTLVGGSFSQIADVAASHPTDKEFTWDATSTSIGGAAVSEISQLGFTLDESLEVKHTLGSGVTPSRIKHTGFRTLEINGTLLFENQNEYQQYISQSERELIVTMNGTTEIQSGYNDQMVITVPKMRYTEFKPAAGGPGEIEVSFSAKGVYDTGSATLIQIDLRNTQAAY